MEWFLPAGFRRKLVELLRLWEISVSDTSLSVQNCSKRSLGFDLCSKPGSDIGHAITRLLQVATVNTPRVTEHRGSLRPGPLVLSLVRAPSGLGLGVLHQQTQQADDPMHMWVYLKIGYFPNYSHLIGIMISKTHYFQTHPCHCELLRGATRPRGAPNAIFLQLMLQLFEEHWYVLSFQNEDGHEGTSQEISENIQFRILQFNIT